MRECEYPWLQDTVGGPRLKCIESFCGPGGMALGLHSAGFESVFAFDANKRAVETFRLNMQRPCEVLDAAKLDPRDVMDRAGVEKGELPLWSGGPPCQGFSKQKRGAHLGDHRNDLVSVFIRFVDYIEPQFFMFENVKIFGQKRGRRYIAEMGAVLRQYRLFPHFYNCADYGLAQTRERFVVVGQHRAVAGAFRIPRPTTTRWTTVGDVLGGVPEPPADYSEHPEYPNHQRARVTKVNIDRFSHVPQGGGWRDIPWELRLPCHQRVDTSSGGWPDVYGRLEWDGQCPTITGGFDSFTRGRYGHPLQDRPLTPYEAARLQGFPHGYRFVGTRADVRSQIGNAVPPPLARAIGIEIRRVLLPEHADTHVQSYQDKDTTYHDVAVQLPLL